MPATNKNTAHPRLPHAVAAVLVDDDFYLYLYLQQSSTTLYIQSKKNSIHCQSSIKKKLNGVIKPFHLSTNPEILVKIGPLAS